MVGMIVINNIVIVVVAVADAVSVAAMMIACHGIVIGIVATVVSVMCVGMIGIVTV